MKKIIGPEKENTVEITPIKDVKKTAPKKDNGKNKQPKTKGKRAKFASKDGRGKRDWSFYAIVVSLIIILIPTLIVGVTLFRATRGTGKPIIGHRFDNDLAPKIEKDDMSALQQSLESIKGVEKVNVELKTATLRIYLDMPQESDKKAVEAAANEAEKILNSKFDPKQYFSAEGSKLQYDYEIYTYNELSEDSLIYIINKTSRMTKANKQYLSEPVSKEMRDELLEIQNNRDNPVKEGVEGEGAEVETTE
ncbi:hypothetical protein ERUR111494_01700 [Erysipelothrix urinaevulpis]|uniref:hypothetical protein n=1 Tax=Erysipelothrix urinaevulpis TaxID=2683717 RepID=UPI001358207A|nr:hypothetical protein [Erysipelothrix urinaevulpis]